MTLIGLLWLAAWPASALIMTGTGSQPVHDYGWPEGALAVANLDSRVGWWEGPPFGGGEWHFLYQGDTAACQEAVAAFAGIRAPVLDLFVHDGPQEDGILTKKVDWSFTVWVPENWHRLFNNPKSVFDAGHPNFRQPVAAPRLDVYVGGNGVDRAKIKVPAALKVHDERAAAAPVQPAGGAVLRADIYDMANGKPVEDAHLTVLRLPAASQEEKPAEEKVADGVSDEQGQVEITRIPAGTYRVTAGADGYATRVLSYERFTDRTFKQFTVELAKSAVLSGRVIDTEGKPVNGARVYAQSIMALDGRGYAAHEERTVESDATGHFALAGLPVGYALLGARKQGYSFSDLFTIHDVPATNVVLRINGAGNIHVSVTDSDGKAMSRYDGHEILVEVEPKGGSKVGSWGGSARVKDDGTFEFTDVPPGEYRITSHPNPSGSNRQSAREQIVTVVPNRSTQVKVVYE